MGAAAREKSENACVSVVVAAKGGTPAVVVSPGPRTGRRAVILDLGPGGAAGFERSTAAQLARLSELSYETTPTVRASVRAMEARLAKPTSRGGT